MQLAETPEKEAPGDKLPEVVMRSASSRLPAIVVSFSALAIIGAAVANFLPSFDSSLPKFSLSNLNQFSLPNFDRFVPRSSQVAASAPKAAAPIPKAPVPIPDPVVTAALREIQISQRDIQTSQDQSTAILVSLTQTAASQQADLKRITRQLNSLAAQTEALQNSASPLTTGSIPHTNPRARIVRTAPKADYFSPLPKPIGPVSVGGAPLGPPPAWRSGSG